MSNKYFQKFFSKSAVALFITVEALFLTALALYMITLGFTHDKEWAPYLGVIVMALLGAAGLFGLARGVARGKRWANSPAILANLIALGVAKYQFEAGLYFLALPIVVVAVIIIFGSLQSIKKFNS